MASLSSLSLTLCALVLFNGCFSQIADLQAGSLEQLGGDQSGSLWQLGGAQSGLLGQLGGGQSQSQWPFSQSQQQQQQQRRLRSRSECQFERITARNPTRQIESEAGLTEFWDSNNEEFVCAGVDVVRNTIHRRGLLLPYYTNAPQLIYIVQGSGIQGTVMPGCAETYEESVSSSERRQRLVDRHQKVYRFKEGDILALPAGLTQWAYNDGETPIVSISLQDTSNVANQLDENFRIFFIAGNPQQQRRERESGQEQEGRRQKRGEEQEAGNIFNGFNEEILSEIFNVESETIRKIQGQDDQRGRIVRAERFEVVSPEWEEREERDERERDNGVTETVCSMKFRENIGRAVHADVFNPRGGRITTLNSQKLPVLSWLQLSAERGVLYRNAVLAPKWNLNAHSVIYITRGGSRLQIVGNNGKAVFDDEVREGQIVVVPQNFAVIKKAGEQGCEWVALKTNDNAVASQLAGRASVIQSLPRDVLANAYGISREQARNLKFNRQEALVFSPGSRSRRE